MIQGQHWAFGRRRRSSQPPVCSREELETQNFDYFICEADFPDMSGANLIRWIRRNPSGMLRFIPIVILTGFTQFGRVVEARDCGANMVVKKPAAPGHAVRPYCLVRAYAASVRGDGRLCRPGQAVQVRRFSGWCRAPRDGPE